ncbi:FtsX-like permease family protein [Baekduia soli]|uniref:FtsX-like permease family protein n=1 Tax=Baekduia soli TaxID=496014 RepID=A0A5B8U6I9_9ACTN|nr:FtsX-like permease family protein [Baekduia soli]QEC48713.1 FtsX-like permease family protein [Baekduia soli]
MIAHRRRLPTGARLASFSGLSVRTVRARPLRSGLTAGAIVLGVGMVFGVLLLVGTIHSTFGRLYDSLYGRADIVVSGRQSAGSLTLDTIDRVRLVQGVRSAAGDVYSSFRTVDAHGRVERARSARLYVVGVDYAQPDTTDSRQVAGRNPRAGAGEIELDRDWAARHHVGVGDRVRLSTPSGVTTLRVAGLFAFGGGLDLGGYGMASMPVQDARRVMDKPGVWDEITVVVDRGARVADVQARLQRRLGRGVEVVTPQTKNAEAQKQLSGLDVVLYFFSGIALFVGAFLILNSFNMTVLQRMREIGTLRALGASDRRVARSILAEALVLGAVGCVLGLALGAVLAILLLKAMQGFGLPVAQIEYAPIAVIGALATGLVATLAGATWPAVRAARIPPIQAMLGMAGAPRGGPGLRRALIGLALFLPGMLVGGLFWFGDTAQGSVLAAIGGVGSTMVMLLGMVLLAPFVILPLIRLMSRPLRAAMPAEGRLASDAALSNPGRTAATAATLLVALSVVVVNTTIASSFVGSIRSDLDKRFSRDLTVQPLDYQDVGPPQSGISDDLRRRIAAMPETAAVAGRRVLYLTKLPGGGADGLIVAYDPYAYDRVDHVDYQGASRAAVLRGLAAGGVVPSKTYAQARGLHVGDRLTLAGASGMRVAPVVGISDTVDGTGRSLQVSLATMSAVYGVTTDVQLAVKARSAAARAPLAARVDALLARRYPGMEALSNAQLKKRTTDAINQQFAFFDAIVAIAVLVGMLGIVNTLTMSVLERTREIGVLRAVGASRWRVRRTMAAESLLISLAGALAGIVAGLLVATAWILGMRQSAFTDLSLRLPTATLAGIAVLGVVIGVVAAALPARRAARLDPLAALRYE